MKYTEIQYKCRCEGVEHSLHIPERGPLESIQRFMTRAQTAIAAHHWNNKPYCSEATMEYAKVMYDEKDGKVGKAPIAN